MRGLNNKKRTFTIRFAGTGKAGNLRLRHEDASIGCLSGLFGKTREGYYSVSREKRARLELTERSLLEHVRQLALRTPAKLSLRRGDTSTTAKIKG